MSGFLTPFHYLQHWKVRIYTSWELFSTLHNLFPLSWFPLLQKKNEVCILHGLVKGFLNSEFSCYIGIAYSSTVIYLMYCTGNIIKWQEILHYQTFETTKLSFMFMYVAMDTTKIGTDKVQKKIFFYTLHLRPIVHIFISYTRDPIWSNGMRSILVKYFWHFDLLLQSWPQLV